MKKIISIITSTVLCLTSLLTFSACENSKSPQGTPETTESEVVEMTEKDKALNGLTEDANEISLANEGNSDRIKALMKKAEEGGTYTIAVLGGSISQGQGSSTQKNSYGYRVYEWWVKSFPNAKFKFVNGGLGGTNPEMACYRFSKDIEPFKPDFTVIDFTQNTYLDENIKVTYSTLVHKLLTGGSAVMAAYFTRCNNTEYSKGNYIEVPEIKVPHDDIKYVVDKYDLPAIDTDKYIWEYLNKKEIFWPEIYDDYIHPNDQGHKLCANLISLQLENIKASLKEFDGKISEIPELENDKYLNVSCINAKTMGATARGAFKALEGNSSSQRGWRVEEGEGSLTVLFPENVKKARMLVSFGKTKGSLLLTSSDGTTQRIKCNQAVNATLIDIKLDLTKLVTVTSELEGGSASISYIGVEY